MNHAKFQRVPLFVHIPNSGDGKEMTETSGQIDLRPTILHAFRCRNFKRYATWCRYVL